MTYTRRLTSAKGKSSRPSLMLAVASYLVMASACAQNTSTHALSSASFDCKKAANKVEKLVCSDVDLSKMDRELDDAYRKALQVEKSLNNRERVQRYQAIWLHDVRARCHNVTCLKAVYQLRVTQLKAPLQPDNCAVADKGVMGAIANCSSSELQTESELLDNLILVLKNTLADSQAKNLLDKQEEWRKNVEQNCLNKADSYSSSTRAAMVLGCELDRVKARIKELQTIRS